MENETEPKFAGFYAVLTQQGRKIAGRVVNEGTAKGGTVKVWKFRPLRYLGATGWSGGCNTVHGLGNPIWVAQDTVTGRWKTKHGALNNAR